MDQGLGQAEPLLHPLGEAVDVVVALVGQVEQFEDLADDLLAVGPGDLVGDGEEVEEFPDLHPVVDAEVVGHEADDLADGHRVVDDRMARDPPFARGGAEQGGQEPDGRALARAVGADEAEDLALADRQVQVVHGHELAVTLGEVAHLDHGRGFSGRSGGTRRRGGSWSAGDRGSEARARRELRASTADRGGGPEERGGGRHPSACRRRVDLPRVGPPRLGGLVDGLGDRHLLGSAARAL